jgi:hypothetical protein
MNLLTPPLAFLVLWLAVGAVYLLVSRLALVVKKPAAALNKAYTGGEEVKTSRVQPDYSQFFPFAFFFTILHVVTLMLATVPANGPGSFAIAIIYLAGALLGLSILFRRTS